MRLPKIAFISALALTAGMSPALAQQVITAPGIVIILSPGATPTQAALPAAQDPFAMMRQIDAQMDAQMNAQIAQMNQAIEAAQQRIATTPAAFATGNAAGVFVTTISENGRTCSQRIVYPGDGAPAKISVSETGNACAALHFGTPGSPSPAALPATIAPTRPVPAQTIQVRNESQSAPIMLADRDN